MKKIWQNQVLVKVRTPEHLYFAVGSLNWNSSFGGQSGITWWSWRCTHLWSSSLTPWCRMPQRNPCTRVQATRTRTFRATWTSLHSRMAKSVVTYNGILIISENEWTDSYKHPEERLANVILTEKKKIAKEYVQYDTIYIKFSKAWKTKQYGNVLKNVISLWKRRQKNCYRKLSTVVASGEEERGSRRAAVRRLP